MPQMSPLNWTLLFLMFTSIFIIMTMMNYYLFNYKIQSYKTESLESKINWKW